MKAEEDDRPVVLITGSAGFIGSRLVEDLHSDFRVVGLDKRLPDLPTPDVFTFHCDLSKDDYLGDTLVELRRMFGDKIASVVHLAAHCDYSGRPSPLYRDLNVGGTRRLLEQLQEFDVQQFVFLSSLLVMEPSEDGHPLNEFSAIQPSWDYPISKRSAEWVVANRRSKIPAVVLRAAGVYDDDCHLEPLACQIARIAERTFDSHLFPGNKDSGRPFLHVDDLVVCLRRIIERRDRLYEYELFLVGEEKTMTYSERQDRLGELLHRVQWQTIRIPTAFARCWAWFKRKMAAARHNDPLGQPWLIDLAGEHYPVNVFKAQKRLDWHPEHKLQADLATMVANMRSDPKRWYDVNRLPIPSRCSSDNVDHTG